MQSGTCYNDYVIGSPSNYDNAYFEISYVMVFSQQGKNTIVTSSSAEGLSYARGLWSLVAGFSLALLAVVVL